MDMCMYMYKMYTSIHVYVVYINTCKIKHEYAMYVFKIL